MQVFMPPVQREALTELLGNSLHCRRLAAVPAPAAIRASSRPLAGAQQVRSGCAAVHYTGHCDALSSWHELAVGIQGGMAIC